MNRFHRLVMVCTLSILSNRIYADQPEYLSVNLHQSNVGMFSVFNYVAGVLHEYDTHPQKYAGVRVDFENNGLYYDPNHGSNWWEYYCEPINFPNEKQAKITQTISKYVHYSYTTDRVLERQRVHSLIQKYIKVRPFIQEKVEQFAVKNFTDYHVIAIHYRGTDKKQEAPRVPYDFVSTKVEEYISEQKLQKYKIFVASDEQQFVEHMQHAFPNSIIVYNAQRSSNDSPLHYATLDKDSLNTQAEKNNQYRQGEEALIDCLLLSRGNMLIRTSSNLSLWSTFFNPSIPVIVLNERYSSIPESTLKILLKYSSSKLTNTQTHQ